VVKLLGRPSFSRDHRRNSVLVAVPNSSATNSSPPLFSTSPRDRQSNTPLYFEVVAKVSGAEQGTVDKSGRDGIGSGQVTVLISFGSIVAQEGSLTDIVCPI
ncbi:hypothetical protein E2562_009949, partial [Oryza meyeriana var. granulata]